MAHLGKWQLVAEIARGNAGIVYLAIARGEDPFGKLFVLKQLKPELARRAAVLQGFVEEARLAARLVHPNIVAIHEVGVDEDRHFLVMDYLEGVPLARVFRRRNPDFTLGMHLRVICEALHALHYAHTSAKEEEDPLGELRDGPGSTREDDDGPASSTAVVVHRDAGPQNVFITYDGEVKLVDFGIARAAHAVAASGGTKPTPGYLAPEQVRSLGESNDVALGDPRSDVYTIGVMIWEAVAGQRMWAQKADAEVIAAIAAGEIPPLASVAPDAPAQILRIAEKALALAPEDRYASAAHLRIDLEGFLMSSGTNATTRDVADVVAGMFAAERVTVKETIDAQRARLAQSRESGKIAHLPAPSGDPIEAANDSARDVAPRVSSTREEQPSAAKPPLARPPAVVAPRAKIAALPADPPPRRGRGLLIAVVLLLVLTGAAVYALRIVP